MQTTTVGRLCSAVLFSCAFAAQAEITTQDYRDTLPDLDWAAVEDHKIVDVEFPALEVEPAELAVLIAAKIDAPMAAVLNKMQEPNESTIALPIDITDEASITRSLEKFSVSTSDQIDLDWFKNPESDGTYNVSKDELQIVKATAKKLNANPNDLNALNQTIRSFFKTRMMEYQKEGVAGIPPYYVDGKTISTADYLTNSMRPLLLIQKREPAFYQAFTQYPNGGADKYQHQFYLAIEQEDGHTITSLRHWMVEIRDKSTLIGERKFYISHSLDAMHTLILIEENATGDASYVLMGNTTFTQKVTGMGSFVAHKVGRSQVKKTIKPMLLSLQQSFQ